MACEATTYGHKRLAFNGYVVLWKIIAEGMTYKLSNKQLKQIFDVLNNGIVSRPSSGFVFNFQLRFRLTFVLL